MYHNLLRKMFNLFNLVLILGYKKDFLVIMEIEFSREAGIFQSKSRNLPVIPQGWEILINPGILPTLIPVPDIMRRKYMFRLIN